MGGISFLNSRSVLKKCVYDFLKKEQLWAATFTGATTH